MSLNHESASPKSPPIKRRRNKVRKKPPHETCEPVVTGIACVSRDRRCACCGGLLCSPEPCHNLKLPDFEDKDFLPSEVESLLSCRGTEEVNASEHQLCENSSPTLCDNGVQDECRGYSEREISRFVEIIERKLKASLRKRAGSSVCGEDPAARESALSTRVCSEESFEETYRGAVSLDQGKVCARYSHTCECIAENFSKDSVRGLVKPSEYENQSVCESRKPVVLQHEKRYKRYPHVTGSEEDIKFDFKIGNIGKSDELSKWGKLDVADRLVAKTKIGSRGIKDNFEDLERFSQLDKKDFATICRQLFRWSSRLSNRWRCVTGESHVVIHLPSMGYPSEIRGRALRSFNLLQNLQFTRLGWLANENAQVLYILPSDESPEMIALLRDLVKKVRPDVSEDRLWVIQPDGAKCPKSRSLNGSRVLFQSPETYRRVRMLTAGRQAFIVPGVMEEIDVLIAAELRSPMMGPPLSFQNYLLNKSNVANFLQETKVEQPPFVSNLRTFAELCEGLAHLMIAFPKYVTWLIKINYGFCGLQTAFISFKKSPSSEIIASKKYPSKTGEKTLAIFLMEILPCEISFNKGAYKCYTEFLSDFEKYGGLVQPCPHADYRVLSLGVFLENDMAEPRICASGDVFQAKGDLAVDLCFGVPQTAGLLSSLDNLARSVGTELRERQHVGYFGLDVITFVDTNSTRRFWVVDVDPHYTDLIAFTDWVKFCLEVRSPRQFCRSKIPSSSGKKNRIKDPCKMTKPNDTMERYAMCSGKLYSNGLAKYGGSTLVSLCEERNVRYDPKRKQGSMICPIDGQRRALGLVTLYPKRFRAIQEFARSLKVIHELSLEKHNDKIKSNMLPLVQTLKRMELSGRTEKNNNNECVEY